MTKVLPHNKVDLALHELRGAAASSDGGGRPLLLLHGLGESSPSAVPPYAEAWPGPVFALDFTGHGDSTVPPGGGYTAEVLMSDVDVALAELGPSTLLGRGIGAYAALLTAGARPKLVRGAILAAGPGMAGGGPTPTSPYVIPNRPYPYSAPDPMALAELTRDVRPPDYASSFVRLATQFSGLATPIMVTALARPPWLLAVVDEPGVQEATIEEAIDFYARMET